MGSAKHLFCCPSSIRCHFIALRCHYFSSPNFTVSRKAVVLTTMFQVLMGRPDAVFVINADVCGDLPLNQMLAFQQSLPLSPSCLIMTTEVGDAPSKILTFRAPLRGRQLDKI